MANRQTIASAKYNAKTYEDIKIRVKKGERKNFKVLAKRMGLSVNQLFLNAVEYYVIDNARTPVKNNDYELPPL